MLTKIEINFVKIKLWLIIVIIQAGSFAMGMYTAHTYWIPKPQASAKLDYSTEKANEQKTEPASTPATNTNTSAAPTNTSTSLDPTNCTTIKGNISGANKTYHVPSGSFYDRTAPEMCFTTEAEAKAAGFTKSSR